VPGSRRALSLFAPQSATLESAEATQPRHTNANRLINDNLSKRTPGAVHCLSGTGTQAKRKCAVGRLTAARYSHPSATPTDSRCDAPGPPREIHRSPGLQMLAVGLNGPLDNKPKINQSALTAVQRASAGGRPKAMSLLALHANNK
jgi:hypothetical protein